MTVPLTWAITRARRWGGRRWAPAYWSAACGTRGAAGPTAPPRPPWPRQPGGRTAAPDVADGQRQGVGRVGRARRLVQPEDPADHRADLVLGGPARAGDGRLDLARRVQADRDAATGRHQHRDARGLGGSHHGLHVVLGEDPLDGHRGRPVRGDPARPRPLDHHQPAGGVEIGRGAHARRRRSAAAAGRERRRPRRGRTWSDPGRYRAPACRAPDPACEIAQRSPSVR